MTRREQLPCHLCYRLLLLLFLLTCDIYTHDYEEKEKEEKTTTLPLTRFSWQNFLRQQKLRHFHYTHIKIISLTGSKGYKIFSKSLRVTLTLKGPWFNTQWLYKFLFVYSTKF